MPGIRICRSVLSGTSMNRPLPFTVLRRGSRATSVIFPRGERHTSSKSALQIAGENQKPHLSFRSLIEVLRDQHDLADIKSPISPDLDVAAVTRRVYETRSPAPLFHNVTGIDPKTGLFKILGAPVGLRKDQHERHGRLAIQLGLKRSSTPREIVEKLIEARYAKHLPPVPIDAPAAAPCKQNILHGDQIDFNKWPIPRLHAKDGGNYLGSYGFHIVRSPDQSWTSWSISRTMHIAGEPRRLTAPVMSGQHLAQVRQMWIDKGAQETPWAMVFGGPPAAAFVGGMPLPSFVSEDGYIGALSGCPMEVVKCETNDLYVPANAEVILEGRLSNSKTAPEGPMGEYHGYSFDDAPIQEPVFEVDCVTYRDDPIIPICVAGKPADETHTVWGTSISAELLAALREGDFPVDFVWLPFEASAVWIVVSVDIEKLAKTKMSASELSRRAGELIFKTHAGWEAPKIFLVGNDVDITDIHQFVWAFATRYRPGAGEFLFDDAQGIPMVPYMTRAERDGDISDAGQGGRSVINLLLPSEYEGKRTWWASDFDSSFPADVKERAVAKMVY